MNYPRKFSKLWYLLLYRECVKLIQLAVSQELYMVLPAIKETKDYIKARLKRDEKLYRRMV